MNEIIEKFALDFIRKNFDKIDLEKVEWDVKNIKDAIVEIKEKDYIPGWIITEVMVWGCDQNYINEYIVDNDQCLFIFKIEERYFTIDFENFHFFKEVFPEEVVTIVYK